MSPSVLDEDAPPPAARKTGAIDGVAGTAGNGGASRLPSNVKRAKPASECTPPPTPIPLEKRKAYSEVDVDNLVASLASFTAPDEDTLPRVGEQIAPHQMPEVEQLFELCARVGNPLLPWETIRPVFLWKIRHVMEEMVRVERVIDARVLAERAASGADSGPPPPPPPHQVRGGVPYRPPAEGWEDETSELRESYRFILGKAASFTGAPFTFQRLCELLSTPLRHYKKADKYFRALEKCINVVTCVTEMGVRITGCEGEEEEELEEEDEETNENTPPFGREGRIERFFGRVDELDEGGEPFNAATAVPGGSNGTATTVHKGSGDEISMKKEETEEEEGEGEKKKEGGGGEGEGMETEEEKPIDMTKKEE